MAAVEFVEDKAEKRPFAPTAGVAARVSDAVRARGVLLRALGSTLVFSPPLIAAPGDIEVIVAAVKGGIEEVQGQLGR